MMLTPATSADTSSLVIRPGAYVAGNLAAYDPATGRLLDAASAPASFAPAVHDHGGLYYTKAAVDGLLLDKANAADLDAHAASQGNPHAVTAAQVGAYTKAEADAAIAGKLDQVQGFAGNLVTLDGDGGLQDADVPLSDLAYASNTIPRMYGAAGQLAAFEEDGTLVGTVLDLSGYIGKVPGAQGYIAVFAEDGGLLAGPDVVSLVQMNQLATLLHLTMRDDENGGIFAVWSAEGGSNWLRLYAKPGQAEPPISVRRADETSLAGLREDGQVFGTSGNFSGAVTAASFAGSGADLTGLTAGQVGAYTSAQVDNLLAAKADAADLAGHIANQANPHAVSAAQVGAYTRAETDALVAAAGGEGGLVVTKSADAVLTADEATVLVDAGGGPVAITLASAADCTGKSRVIKKTDASGNLVTVQGGGGQTIDGQSSWLLELPDEWVQLVSDGANWRVIGD